MSYSQWAATMRIPHLHAAAQTAEATGAVLPDEAALSMQYESEQHSHSPRVMAGEHGTRAQRMLTLLCFSVAAALSCAGARAVACIRTCRSCTGVASALRCSAAAAA